MRDRRFRIQSSYGAGPGREGSPPSPEAGGWPGPLDSDARSLGGRADDDGSFDHLGRFGHGGGGLFGGPDPRASHDGLFGTSDPRARGGAPRGFEEPGAGLFARAPGPFSSPGARPFESLATDSGLRPFESLALERPFRTPARRPRGRRRLGLLLAFGLVAGGAGFIGARHPQVAPLLRAEIAPRLVKAEGAVRGWLARGGWGAAGAERVAESEAAAREAAPAPSRPQITPLPAGGAGDVVSAPPPAGAQAAAPTPSPGALSVPPAAAAPVAAVAASPAARAEALAGQPAAILEAAAGAAGPAAEPTAARPTAASGGAVDAHAEPPARAGAGSIPARRVARPSISPASTRAAPPRGRAAMKLALAPARGAEKKRRISNAELARRQARAAAAAAEEEALMNGPARPRAAAERAPAEQAPQARERQAPSAPVERAPSAPAVRASADPLEALMTGAVKNDRRRR